MNLCCGDNVRARLESASARQQVEDQNDNGENQQKMNPAAQRITADQAEEPEYDQDNGDRPKHNKALRNIVRLGESHPRVPPKTSQRSLW
jgi:hypothetical protein